jgi:hypothetical protein
MEDQKVIEFIGRKRDWEVREKSYRKRHLRMLGWVMLFAIPIWALILGSLWVKFH